MHYFAVSVGRLALKFQTWVAVVVVVNIFIAGHEQYTWQLQ